ncbi:MAG: site-specific integrase [Mycobacteriaceae bacterium]
MAGTRAPNGESPIYQDKDGRWHGYVSMGLKRDGVRDRRHVSSARRTEVVRKVRVLERKRDEGLATAAGKAPTVEAWLRHWVNVIAARRVRPSTLERYRGIIRRQVGPALGHHRLDRLQPEHVEQLYADLESQGLAPATILQVHRVLSRALKVAMQRGKVPRNVCSLVDAPSGSRREIDPFGAEEARAVLGAAAGQRNAARWSVALALGLRQGEALGLRWSDVTLTTRRLPSARPCNAALGRTAVAATAASARRRAPPEAVAAWRSSSPRAPLVVARSPCPPRSWKRYAGTAASRPLSDSQPAASGRTTAWRSPK